MLPSSGRPRATAGVDELAFEYVGRKALTKKYGSLPLYHVRRT